MNEQSTHTHWTRENGALRLRMCEGRGGCHSVDTARDSETGKWLCRACAGEERERHD